MENHIIYEIQILYIKFVKASRKYENITTIDNAKKFMNIEKELYDNLDLLNLDEDKWLIDDEHYNVCKKCNYKFIRLDKYNVKYKKILHELFHCSI